MTSHDNQIASQIYSSPLRKWIEVTHEEKQNWERLVTAIRKAKQRAGACSAPYKKSCKCDGLCVNCKYLCSPKTKKLKETVDGETRYYLPLEADLEWASKFGYNREDFVHVMLGMRRIRCIRIPATKQQYDEFMRPYLSEAQADWRSQKCMVPSEKTGKLVRCKRPCKECPYMKSGAKLSLDRFIDEGGFEKYEKAVDEEASTLTSLLFSELLGKLEEQAPELADIFGRMFDGASQRELERELGIAHGTMTDRVAAMRKILQRYVSREDIVG